MLRWQIMTRWLSIEDVIIKTQEQSFRFEFGFDHIFTVVTNFCGTKSEARSPAKLENMEFFEMAIDLIDLKDSNDSNSQMTHSSYR